MKKRTVLLIVFTVWITAVWAQNQVIKINPAGYFFDAANLSYENATSWPSGSYQINLNYGNLSAPGVKYTGLGAGIDFRHYFSNTKDAPRGLYLSAGLLYTYIKVMIDGEDSKSIPAGGAKLSLGYQWVWDSGFALDLFAGYNYNFYHMEDSGIKYHKYRGLPVVGLAFGYGFGKDD